MSKHIQTQKSVEEIEKDVKQYTHLIQHTIPQLTSKRKTHLCTHLIEDIKEHGDLTDYCEDPFEKNHSSIRAELFVQNQQAKSRDTAMQFCRNAVLHHIINGGYFNIDNVWLQASELVQSYGQELKIQCFLGQQDEDSGKRVSFLKKIEHPDKENTKVMTEVQILQALINSKQPTTSRLDEIKTTFYKSVVTESGEVAYTDGCVLYTYEEEERIGKILSMVGFSGVRQCEVVIVLRGREVGEGKYVQSVIFDEEEIIPVKDIKQIIHHVHDCSGGRCTVKETKKKVKMEQEEKEITVKTIRHNKTHAIYFINKFRLTHVQDDFKI